MNLLSGTVTVELGVFALIGLLGGAHCIGMCGPIASLYAQRYSDQQDGAETVALVRQQLVFNLGRTTGYVVLGFVFGLLGTILYDVAAISRYGTLVRAIFGVIAGAFIISVGIYRLSGRMDSVLDCIPGGQLGGRVLGRVHRTVSTILDSWVSPPRVLALGMTHSVLPCPLLFPAYLYAFTRGDPVLGAAALGVLGISTVPTMMLIGTTTGSLHSRIGLLPRRALGAVFLVMGCIPLSHGLAMLGIDVPHLQIPVYQPLILL